MLYWPFLISILIWFLKFIMNNWVNDIDSKKSAKTARALRIMEEILEQSRVRGFRAEQGYTLDDMLK